MIEGKYVVIEGHDGTGKSTQVGMLREYLAEQGVESIEFHEPEGTPMADALRRIIKNGELERSAKTNLLLFTAARHEIWHERALPALKMGTWVVAARNYYSTLAYQGYGEGLDRELITSLTAQFTDERYLRPDLSVILTLDDASERARRIGERGELETRDTFESRPEDFQGRVQAGYVQIAHEHHLPIISAQQTPQAVFEEIKQLLPVA